MASSGSTNPFCSNNDDDFSFSSRNAVSGSSSGYSGSHYRGKDPFLEDEEEVLSPFQQRQRQKENSMNNQLEGTQRALASLYDSERMGIATAEELVQQGEQLDNVENKLDTVNQEMKTSQRHINSIKSVFGGLKNWWKGEPKQDAVAESGSRRDPSSLSSSMAACSDAPAPPPPSGHPGARHTQGFYDDSAPPERQPSSKSADMQAYEKQLDSNLDAMSAGLSRLKGLGTGLGQEISAQNEQIERIGGKAERADTTVKDQNRQIRHILGK